MWMEESNYYSGFDSTQEKGFLDKLKDHIVDFIQSFVVIGAIFAIIYWQIAQPHKVSGSSMVSTFHNNDLILTDKVSYKLSNPQYGDIIVFKNPRNKTQDFIKRVIAVEGDSVSLIDNKLYVNNQPLTENYLDLGIITSGGNFLKERETITIGQDHFFVVGDNRPHSSDSREWGTISRDEIIGKVFLRYWPLTDFKLIKHLP